MNATDDTFLDDLFDRVLAELLDGREPDTAALIGGREHLLERGREVIGLARAVAGSRSGPLTPARTIGGFDLIEELGRGASSVVHLARQKAVGGRLVALKLLAQGPFANARAQRRFATEVRALARVRHPNIVPVLDVVETDEVHGYAMEWVRGQSLADLIRRHREGSSSDANDPAGFREAQYVPWVCRLGVQLGRALQAVHDAGLLHRDVKPSNVLIGDRGEALLADFGLVHDAESSLNTRTGDFLGTLAYSAPEQIRGAGVDVRADVYGLGATLYHALCMVVPAHGQSVTAVLAYLEGHGVPPLRRVLPQLPRDLETVVQMAMAPEPERRYASADAFADDLQRVLDLLPVRARRPGPGYRSLRFVQRNRAVVAGIVLGLGVAMAAFAFSWWQQQRDLELEREVTQSIEDARLVLVDAQLIGRLRLQMRRGQPVQVESTLALLGTAIAAYDRALELAPDREGLRLERATLEAGMAKLRGAAVPTSRLQQACPTAWTYAQGGDVGLTAQATSVDARALGVLAYLAGDLDRAVSALEFVESRDHGDAFVDGLLGAVLDARGAPERALPRIVRLADRFPDHATPQAEAALVAAACGDVPLAERFIAAARAAAVPTTEDFLHLVLGDIAWLREDAAGAERHYQAANAYSRLIQLWTARGQWRLAIISAINYIPLEPGEPLHRRMLLIAARAWWAERTAEERDRLLRGAIAGELCDVGQLMGVLIGIDRARRMLADVGGGAAAPIISPGGRARFAAAVMARSRDPFDALVARMQVARLDLVRLGAAPAATRERLVAAWLDPAGAERATAIVNGLSAWLPDGADPFELSVGRALPEPLTEVAEIARPQLGVGAMWSPAVVTLNGPEPRIVVVGGAVTDAERARGAVELCDGRGALIETIRGRGPMDGLGSAVVNVGDIDGDGIEDAGIATGGRARSSASDQLYLVSGGDGRVLHVLDGVTSTEAFGKCAIGLGDVDGDGTVEIAVAAPQADHGGRSRCGVVRVLGVDGNLAYELAGGRALDAYGQRLAMVGDIDGDGVADFAVGTECQLPPHYADVISGRGGERLFRVEATDYRVGSTSVAGPGDIDGDGTPDLLVGFSTLMPWQQPAGRVEFVSGRTGKRFRTVTGDRLGEGFALELTMLGDVDGDGRRDFAAAATCDVAALPPTVYVFSVDGRRLARLPGVWQLWPLADADLAAVTISVWSRYASSPMATGARVTVARWR